MRTLSPSMKITLQILRPALQRYATSKSFSITLLRRCYFSSSKMASKTLLDITATPAVDQHILHDGKEYTTIKEGLAYILIPAEASKTPQTTPKGDNQAQSVFYNPIQQFNRDLSVLAIKAYGEDVIAKKQKASDKFRQNQSAKKKEKKRKREENLGNGPRKAGKMQDAASAADVRQEGRAVSEPVTGEGDLSIRETEPETTLAQPPGDQESDAIPGEVDVRKENLAPNPPRESPSPTFTILDALSATGLRALRYSNEIPFTTSVTANDLLPAATKTIKLNIEHNKLEAKIQAVTGNAITHMYSLLGENIKDEKGRMVPSKKYDVIDLDPYGTAAPFLDAAVQSVRDDGGLLCVTCTDAGVWASNGYPEKAFSLYGGIPIKGMHSHEGGLRLILHSIATTAARYGLAIEPLLSLSIDFYARVFVRVHKSPADVKFLAGKTMVVYNCDTGCGAWTTQMIAKNKLSQNKSGKGYFWKHVFEQAPMTSEKCVHCGMKTHIAGPMYAGPLHSPDFVKKILNGLSNVSKDTYHTTERIEGMLSMALEESLLPLEENTESPTLTSKTGKHDPAIVDLYPFFFIPSVLAKVVHCITPHENALRGALRHLGYRVTRSHTKPGSIKTDAPWEVIWEVMREWVKQKAPVKEGAIRKETAGWNIMRMGGDLSAATKEDTDGAAVEGKSVKESSKSQPKPKIVFDEALGKEKDAKRLVRFQINPRENWGPMNRAKGPA